MCRIIKQPDHTQLRSAFGQFPTGVAIVTIATPEGGSTGITINSFSSVSLSPALVSWCIDVNSGSYFSFALAPRFTITVLAEDQQEIARRYATRGIDKSAGESIDDMPPAIPDGCAEYHCDTYRTTPMGDHLMIVGKVRKVGTSDRKPLLFMNGRFYTNELIAA